MNSRARLQFPSGKVVRVRLAATLEFPRSREINLFVDPRRTNARCGKQETGTWERGEGVLDVRVSRCEMELTVSNSGI